jgi:hypothetical protein
MYKNTTQHVLARRIDVAMLTGKVFGCRSSNARSTVSRIRALVQDILPDPFFHSCVQHTVGLV